MDVKLGMRTHLQADVQNDKPRADLFQKMLKSFPSDLTSSELKTQMVTKSRYMEVRDASSTTGSLGYRVDGVAGYGNGLEIGSKHNSSATDDAARKAFRDFAYSVRGNDGHDEIRLSPAEVAERVVEQLQNLRSAFEASAFVQQHECIGTSVLITIDACTGQCNASWIDFAKTRACQKPLSHRELPTPGNQEEGLLLGVDNLISAWQELAHESHICARSSSLRSKSLKLCDRENDSGQDAQKELMFSLRVSTVCNTVARNPLFMLKDMCLLAGTHSVVSASSYEVYQRYSVRSKTKAFSRNKVTRQDWKTLSRSCRKRYRTAGQYSRCQHLFVRLCRSAGASCRSRYFQRSA